MQYIKKERILYVLYILLHNTDKNHTLTINEIIQKLQVYGIKTERKSIYNDISLLRKFGIDITMKKTKYVSYYMEKFFLNIEELQYITAAVRACDFISAQNKDYIISKLKELTSIYNYKQYIENNILICENHNLNYDNDYLKIKTIKDAFIRNKKISFKYLDIYSLGKINTMEITASPYYIAKINDKFYLIAGNKHYENGIKYFSLDKIFDINILNEFKDDIFTVTGDIDFSIQCYIEGIFGIYSEDSVEICLYMSKSKLEIFENKFGSVEVSKGEHDNIYVKFNIAVNREIISWLMMFEDVKIIYPTSLIDSIRIRAKNIYDLYSKKTTTKYKY